MNRNIIYMNAKYTAICNVNTTLHRARVAMPPNKVRNFQWKRPSQSLLAPRNRTAPSLSRSHRRRESNVNKNKRNTGCIGKSLAKLRRIVRVRPALLEKWLIRPL